MYEKNYLKYQFTRIIEGKHYAKYASRKEKRYTLHYIVLYRLIGRSNNW